MNLEKIAEHFIQKIITSDSFLLNQPIRDMNLLYPEMRVKIERLLAKCYESGKSNLKYFKVFESFRSASRQRAMYNDGTSQRATNGMHWFGIAADIVGSYP
ncbi:MAG: hypothetical protein J0M18_21560, partial [Ignavibacteria bacterium]|nr:hypothetical protein [Ignavibacteria bacterium]